jgi:quinol monooxygenase YgiN
LAGLAYNHILDQNFEMSKPARTDLRASWTSYQKMEEGQMVDMVVTQRVNPGMEQAFEALARQLTTNTLANDKGCLRYEWYRAVTPQTYILIERWTDMAAVQAHLKAEHLAAIMPEIRECVPEMFSVIELTRLQ